MSKIIDFFFFNHHSPRVFVLFLLVSLCLLGVLSASADNPVGNALGVDGIIPSEFDAPLSILQAPGGGQTGLATVHLAEGPTAQMEPAIAYNTITLKTYSIQTSLQ